MDPVSSNPQINPQDQQPAALNFNKAAKRARERTGWSSSSSSSGSSSSGSSETDSEMQDKVDGSVRSFKNPGDNDEADAKTVKSDNHKPKPPLAQRQQNQLLAKPQPDTERMQPQQHAAVLKPVRDDEELSRNEDKRAMFFPKEELEQSQHSRMAASNHQSSINRNASQNDTDAIAKTQLNFFQGKKRNQEQVRSSNASGAAVIGKGKADQAFFVMPEDWKPGQPVRVPDPNDPTKVIEIPADAVDMQAVQGYGQIRQQQQQPEPNVQAELGANTANLAAGPRLLAGKGKKKKKKKLVQPQAVDEAKGLERELAVLSQVQSQDDQGSALQNQPQAAPQIVPESSQEPIFRPMQEQVQSPTNITGSVRSSQGRAASQVGNTNVDSSSASAFKPNMQLKGLKKKKTRTKEDADVDLRASDQESSSNMASRPNILQRDGSVASGLSGLRSSADVKQSQENPLKSRHESALAPIEEGHSYVHLDGQVMPNEPNVDEGVGFRLPQDDYKDNVNEQAEPERQPEWDVSLPKDQKLDQLINDIAGPGPEVQQAIPAAALVDDQLLDLQQHINLQPAEIQSNNNQAAHVPEADSRADKDKDKPLNAGFGDMDFERDDNFVAKEEVAQPSLDFKHDEVQEELMMMQPELQAPQAVEGHVEENKEEEKNQHDESQNLESSAGGSSKMSAQPQNEPKKKKKVTIQEPGGSDSDEQSGELTMLQKLAQMDEQPAAGSEEEVSEYESEEDGDEVAPVPQAPKKTDYEKCMDLGYSKSYLETLPPSHLRQLVENAEALPTLEEQERQLAQAQQPLPASQSVGGAAAAGLGPRDQGIQALDANWGFGQGHGGAPAHQQAPLAPNALLNEQEPEFQQPQSIQLPEQPKNLPILVPNPTTDVFALEKYDPEKKKLERKLEKQLQKIDDKFDDENEKILRDKMQIELDSNMARYRNILYLIRLVSSAVMTFDLCSKISYYYFSSFLSTEIKDLYWCFMMLRPLSVILLLVYNFCFSVKEICTFASRGKGIAAPLVTLRKEDEVGLVQHEGGAGELTQEEAARLEAEARARGLDLNAENPQNFESTTNFMKQQEPSPRNDPPPAQQEPANSTRLLFMIRDQQRQRKRKAASLIFEAFLQHIMLVSISLTGWIRALNTKDTDMKYPLFFSYAFELITMSIPLMLLQFYQNSQMARDNEQKLDKANLYAFVANICFFLIECTLHQALIPDQEWSVISKKRIGFYEIEDKGGATDNSDEIDEHVSSSEEDMSVTDAVSESNLSRSNPSETGAVLERRAGKKVRDKLQREDLEFLTKVDKQCRETGFIFIVSMALLVVFGLIATNTYERKKCGQNTYEITAGFCQDCLKGLGFHCLECSQLNVCDKCADGYHTGLAEFGIVTQQTCLKCRDTHNDACLTCNDEKCLKCKPGYNLYKGVCHDCKAIPNSLTCDDKNAYSCKKGFFLTQEAGVGVCRACSTLPHCLECSDGQTCTKCAKDIFAVSGGKCECKLGAGSLFDPINDRCYCRPDYYMTTEGCRTCEMLAPNCRLCQETTKKTHAELGDQYLQGQGKYVECQSCPYTSYLSIKTRAGKPESRCINCSTRAYGCLRCGQYGDYCQRCRAAYASTGSGASLKCNACDEETGHCDSCDSVSLCTGCQDGYHLIFGQCNQDL